jgi:HEAT repeat protein
MDLLELGIAAARAGNRADARMFLEAATLGDPTNAQAFLWLSFVLDDRRLAQRCLERVLELDPDNEYAKRGMTWLRSQKTGKTEPLPEHLSDAEMSALLLTLDHPDEQLVIKTILRLGQAGDARAVDPLIGLLTTTKSKTVQSQARTALIAIGTPSVEPVLRRLMSESHVEMAIQLAAVLARVHSMAALAACREVAERAEHASTRYAMALNLTTSIHGEPALGIVRDYLENDREDQRARAAVLTAIGQAIKGRTLAADQGIKFLLDIISDPRLSSTFGYAALTALGISSHPSALRHLLEAMSHKDVQMRVVAVEALGKFAPPPRSLLERLARSPDQAVRARANQILATLPPVPKS